jgi:hypothetical protein
MVRKSDSLPWGALALLALLPAGPAAAAPPPAHTKEHTITIDATTLHPPTRWQVPGVTPMIMTLDPESTDAYLTSERRELKLKPGSYQFGTFTFGFPFNVGLDGKLDFTKSLDQCVAGRGTQMLTVTCSRMYPYGGKRDYDYQDVK